MKREIKTAAEAKEAHVDAINAAIDALINLEDFTPLPAALSNALSKLNSMRNTAEAPVDAGTEVWDTVNKEYGIVKTVGALNYFFEDEVRVVGIKYCFPV